MLLTSEPFPQPQDNFTRKEIGDLGLKVAKTLFGESMMRIRAVLGAQRGMLWVSRRQAPNRQGGEVPDEPRKARWQFLCG